MFIDDEGPSGENFEIPTVILNTEAQADIRVSVGSRSAVRPTPRAMGDLFRLMYTSGTTDRPKGVMHTYENFYVKSAEHVIVFGLTAEKRQTGRASCRARVCTYV